jgi:predicted HicB family RNase H-like nuclease
MQVAPHIEALKADLAAIAGVGDEAVAAAAERLSQALTASFGLRLLDVLQEAALEVSEQVPSGHVEVRLAGQEPLLVYVEDEQAQAARTPAAEEGMAARITLRLAESLKAAVEEAATREGLSVNAWLVRALTRAVSGGSTPRVGSRLTGYARG